MRTSVYLSGFVLPVIVVSQDPLSLRQFPAELPSCAQQCIAPVLENLGYNNTNFFDLAPLLCNDIPPMVQISACLQIQCTRSEYAAAWPFQKTLCLDEPTSSRAGYIRTLTITMALLAAVFVLLRCYSRIWVVKMFWWDDWDMLIAATLMISIAVLMIWDSTIGLGLHVWEVEPQNVAKIAKVFFIMKLFYVLVQVLLKASILLFYLRCFPVPWIQKCTWVLIFFAFAHGFAFFFAILFQCTPVALLWNPRLQGTCIELRDIIFPGAILAILEDVAIVILPIPCLKSLRIGKGKRISMIAIFSVGAIATITSIIRAKPVWDYRDTLDQSWDTINLLAWSEAELTTATICVCLPSLKSVLNRHFPRYFSGSTKANTPDQPHSNQMRTADQSFTLKLENSKGKSRSRITGGGRSDDGMASMWMGSESELGIVVTDEIEVRNDTPPLVPPKPIFYKSG